MFLLLSFWIIAGIMAENPSTSYHMVINSSLCLHLQKSPPYLAVEWMVVEKRAEILIVTQEKITPRYTDRVDYKIDNHSLCIKNLMKNDSGLYQATITDSNYVKSKESHMVIVQEPVPTPVIKMSVPDSNKTAAPCNITVNCSIQSDWVTSLCSQRGCETLQRSLSAFNISVFTNNSFVVCYGSNNVSTSNASEGLNTRCFNESIPVQEDTLPSSTIILIPTITAMLFCCTALFLYLRKKNRNQEQRLLVQSTQPEAVEAQPPPTVPRLSTSSGDSSSPSYENIDTQPSQTDPPIHTRQEQRSTESEKVDTVYSFLQLSSAPAEALSQPLTTQGITTVYDEMHLSPVNVVSTVASHQV